MTLLQSGLAKSLVSDYTVDQSLRFNDGDSAYLSKTFASTGDRKTWTFSCWVKRADLSDASLFTTGPGSGDDNDNWFAFRFDNDHKLVFGSYSEAIIKRTAQVFRDDGAWMHVVGYFDTTDSVADDRMRIYINGERITAWTTSTNPGLNDNRGINLDQPHYIGVYPDQAAVFMDGYLAEVYFIDGTALTPDSFAETDDTTNQWIPKDAVDDLTFGTNGFYQKYASDGGHTSFTTPGSTTWTAPEGVTSVDYLVVGGGGGGGYDVGGGGGAGGFRTGTLAVVGGTSYTVTVGAGGAGATASTARGVSGGNSVFSSITSSGGGGGGTWTGVSGEWDPADGGSGGGAQGYTISSDGGASSPVTDPVQGYAGGSNDAAIGASASGGGGGGSSAVGQDSQSGSNAAGGAGTSNSLSGSAVTYAAGGVGCTDTSGGGAAGGANTGDGGGGGSNPNEGSNGGSGIVIVKAVTGQAFGLDSSGEGNNFTETNLVATDQMVDSPTNNFCTLNAIDTYSTIALSEGNLQAVESAGTGRVSRSTFMMESGKWYWELCAVTPGTYCVAGISANDWTMDNALGYSTNSYGYFSNNGDTYNNSSGLTYGASWDTANDIIGVAFDADAGTLIFYKNNASQGTAYTGLTSGTYMPAVGVRSATAVMNFGQDSSFAGNVTAQGNQDGNSVGDFYYAPPSGYLALCTSNLSDPEIKLPGDNFNTVLYTGSGGAQSITGVGFEPDWCWQKRRSGADSAPFLFDSLRGQNYLQTDRTDAEGDGSAFFTSFDSDGFTLAGSDGSNNASSSPYVAWNWLAGGGAGSSNTDGDTNTTSTSANVTAGFSISTLPTYSGSTTFGHGLSAAPELVIMKPFNGVDTWNVGSDYLSASDWTQALVLNTTAAEATNGVYWNNTAPTASVVSLGTQGNSYTKVIYCFHSVEGYSKVGSYTGNGNADGTFIYTGFRPAYVMWKVISAVDSWATMDNKINTYNPEDTHLRPNAADAERTDSAKAVDYVSNGFKIRTTDGQWNTSSGTYLYYAVAAYPFKYSPAR
jgi:hypothetical protein